MRLGWLVAAILATAPTCAGAKPELRCGWWENPTPGNVWLTDRDGQWLVGAQGGHQARGDWPDFPDTEWVATNRSYGYGCACLKVVTDPGAKKIVDILSAQARPLKTCRDDRALTEPGH